jgi:hypothetical protein
LPIITLREEGRLRVFKRNKTGHKRKKIREGWRNMHIEDFHNLHSSTNRVVVVMVVVVGAVASSSSSNIKLQHKTPFGGWIN